MCMEDVLIGRRTRAIQIQNTVGATSIQCLDSDKSRQFIIFNPPLTGSITYSTQQTAIAGAGINLAAGCDPFTIDIVTHGDLVTKKWNCIADAGGRIADIFVGCLYE